jgi:hypothetical protein
MILIRMVLAATLIALAPAALAADDVLDAIEKARKSYQSGDLGNAKQSLDLASQLIGQKNAEGFATLLPEPLAGWKAEKAQTSAIGAAAFGGSTASRIYTNAKGEHVELAITGDSAMIAQFAPLLANPQIAGAMGKIVKIGNERAIQNAEGDIHLVVANKFLVLVSGTAGAKDKMAYAGAVDIGKLGKM